MLRFRCRDSEPPDLRSEDYQEHIKRIVDAAMVAADPAKALTANWPLALQDVEGVYMVGAGKAALEMALQLDKLSTIIDGAVSVVPQRLARLAELPGTFTAYPASHPYPDETNIAASEAIARIAREAGEGDILIVLLSGGGSAMLTLPAEGLTLHDLREVTRVLQTAGAPIDELNTVRKHCEQLKGGLLARLAYPAQVWSFILSDVVGDKLNVIASGPTAPDPTTYEDALNVLKKYTVLGQVPAVTRHLERGVRREIPETVQPGDKTLEHVTNMLIGSNRLALEAARQQATLDGWRVIGFEFGVQGEARLIGMEMALRAQAMLDRPDRPVCYLMGGESTVTVHGKGRGGRNQELALAAAITLDGVENVAVGAFATDGVDGQSDAAGAMINGETCAKGRALGLSPEDYLNKNDSNTFFSKVGGLIDMGGPAGTNVNDIVIVLVY